MEKVVTHIVVFLLVSQVCWSQDKVAMEYGNQIVSRDLRGHLSIIASDEMEGRETGMPGQKKAAAYIQDHFEKIGLKGPVDGGYLQHFNLYKVGTGEAYLEVKGVKLKNLKDFIYVGKDDSEGEVSVDLVYVGLGSEDEFDRVNVKDKAALIKITGTQQYNLEEAERAYERGAKTVLFWNDLTLDEFEVTARQVDYYDRSARPKLEKPAVHASTSRGMFMLSPGVVQKIMGVQIDKLEEVAHEGSKSLTKIKPVALKYKYGQEVQTIVTENVLGYLEGTDKKDELVVITAHYDHIGIGIGKKDVINNGADDDGSGTVAVLQLAEVFANAKRDGHGPRRSILFMTVSGEEKGLLGSDYYTRNPVFPLENTVVDLNIDMVGRRDAKHKDSKPYVYIIGSDKLSQELHVLNEKNNELYTQLIFDYTYNDVNHPDRLYYRSDHWNFAKNNIPIIFYFDGIHEDYHRPSDEVNKIEFDLLTQRAKCVFYTAWDIANRDKRLQLDEKLIEMELEMDTD